MTQKFRYEEMFVGEFEEAIKEIPVVYLPLGTLEWHGLHLALGTDAVKVHELCVRIAKEVKGGVVAPPNFWAIGGQPHPWTMRFDPELIERLFYAIFEQLSHVGFKVVIALAGHYGLQQIYKLKKAACDFMHKSGITIFPAPEYEVVCDKGYRGDHAAKWETSILWDLRPELVNMDNLDKDLTEPLEGVAGEDPRVHASRKLGEEINKTMVERLADISIRLLEDTSFLARSKFLEVLGKEVLILNKRLEPQMQRRKEIFRRLFGKEDGFYYHFLDLFWRGEYIEANKVADSIIGDLCNQE